jgi:hypothetical protein
MSARISNFSSAGSQLGRRAHRLRYGVGACDLTGKAAPAGPQHNQPKFAGLTKNVIFYDNNALGALHLDFYLKNLALASSRG